MATQDQSNERVDLDRLPQVSQLNPPGIAAPSDEMLRGITSFEDAQALAQEMYGEIQNFADTYGTGFILLPDKDKSKLVDVPFALVYWRLNDGTYGGFVSALVVTERGDKFIVNDGSTGMYRQLAEITATTGKTGGLIVDHGLRESEYPICAGPIVDGKPQPCGLPRTPNEAMCENCGDESERRAVGHTYYLDNT